MHFVRPANPNDIDDIALLIKHNAVRVTTLPEQHEVIASQVALSQQSLNSKVERRQPRSFVFVLQNQTTNEVEGICAIDSHAGNGYPFYNYRMEDLIHASPHLSVHQRIPVLYLSHELTDTTVLRSFALKSGLQNDKAKFLLSISRLMFIARYRAWFSDQIVTELQGVLDHDGQSPFWDSLGRHFFKMDFASADKLVGVNSKTFIAEVMPQHPIYVPLLSPAAQAAMQQVNHKVKGTYQLFTEQGLKTTRFLDIFDGGPVLSGMTDQLPGVLNYQACSVQQLTLDSAQTLLVSTGEPQNFKCWYLDSDALPYWQQHSGLSPEDEIGVMPCH